MQDYPIDGLGDESFEKLVQSLLHVVIGNGTISFGMGPDGSREATFSGSAPYPSLSNRWEGKWIFQAKFHDVKKIGHEKARALLLRDLENELHKIAQKHHCDNYILATNVILTPVYKTGTLDKIANEIIPKFSPHEIKNIHVWGHDDICRYLDGNSDIRHAYGLINPGDVINNLQTRDIVNINTLSDLQNYYNVDDGRLVKVNESISQNLRDQIKKWHITPLPHRKSLFLVTGNPGIGKSWTTYNTISDLLKDGFLIYAITGSDVKKNLLVENEDIKNKIPNSVFILDDYNISLDHIETSLDIDDIAHIIKTVFPSRIPKSLTGPLILSIRDDTWNQILKNDKGETRFNDQILSNIVSKVSLSPLSKEETRSIIRSFYLSSSVATPKYPNITVSEDLENKIIARSKGNPIVVELFFTDIGSGLNGLPYELSELDVSNIIDNAKLYALKLIFQYFLSDLSEEELAIVIEFLYYIVIKRTFSIGHLMYVLNNNNILKQALLKKGNLSKDKPLHLFNLNQNGIINPFHDIISDAIIKLVHNPDKLLSELESENDYVSHNIQKVIDLDIKFPLKSKASEAFLNKYGEYLNGSIQYYTDTLCKREIEKTQKISDETIFMLLSALIEYLWHKNPDNYESYFIQKIIQLLVDNEVNYNQYRDKVETQLIVIFEKLGLFIRPLIDLKKYYLQLCCSADDKVSFTAWSNIPVLIKSNIVNNQEVVDIKTHLLNLLTSNNIAIMNGSWIVVQHLLRFKIIDKSDRDVIINLLKNPSSLIRRNAWKCAPYFETWEIITAEELGPLKEYYLNLLVDPLGGMDSWLIVHDFLDKNIIQIEDLTNTKASLIKNLGDTSLGLKLVYIWPIMSLLYRKDIFDDNDKALILQHLNSESFDLRLIAWVNICKLLDENVLNSEDIVPFRNGFNELFQYNEYDAELWNCLRVLVQKGVLTINEISAQLDRLRNISDDEEDQIILNSLVCLIAILPVETSNKITPKLIKDKAVKLTSATDPFVRLAACNILINLPVPSVIKPKEIIEVKKKIFNFLNDEDEIKKVTAWRIVAQMVKNGLIKDNGIIKTLEILESKSSLFSMLNSSVQQIVFFAWSLIMALTLSNSIDFSEVEKRKESLFSLLDFPDDMGEYAKVIVASYYSLADQRSPKE